MSSAFKLHEKPPPLRTGKARAAWVQWQVAVRAWIVAGHQVTHLERTIFLDRAYPPPAWMGPNRLGTPEELEQMLQEARRRLKKTRARVEVTFRSFARSSHPRASS